MLEKRASALEWYRSLSEEDKVKLQEKYICPCRIQNYPIELTGFEIQQIYNGENSNEI